jgi:Lar family restriction alleviation protein
MRLPALKPCPFCGSRASVVTVIDGNSHDEVAAAKCSRKGCGASIISHEDLHYGTVKEQKEWIVPRWNKRVQ